MVKKIIQSVAFYVLLLVLWQGVFFFGTAVLRWWKPYAFPNPAGVWRSLVTMVGQHTLGAAVLSSLRRALCGYFLSVLLGGTMGMTLARRPVLSGMVKPLILGVQSLPSVCWVPFAILWFGLTEASILFVIVMGAAFGIAITVEGAIRNVPPLYIKAARTMGAGGHMLYFKVILPASLPALITGLKQGWSFAWRALMSAEVMSVAIGLGQALTMGRDLADINRVMLIILVIILFGMVIEKFIFSAAEEQVLKRIGL